MAQLFLVVNSGSSRMSRHGSVLPGIPSAPSDAQWMLFPLGGEGAPVNAPRKSQSKHTSTDLSAIQTLAAAQSSVWSY